MNLSGRERRLLIALAVIIVLGVGFLALRSGADEPLDLGLFPSASPSLSSPSTPPSSPTFVVPSGLRDPFQAQP